MKIVILNVVKLATTIPCVLRILVTRITICTIIVGGVTRIRLGFTETLLDETKDLPAGITVAVESEEGVYVQGALADDGVNVFEIDTRNLKTDGSYRLCVSVPGRGEYISEFKRVVLTPPIDTITWTMSHDSTCVLMIS